MVKHADDLLTSQLEVAEALGMSPKTLQRYLATYPWHLAGRPTGKVNGKWRVPRGDVLAWWEFVRRQESRHPEARRFRPEEPPTLRDIRARGAKPVKTPRAGQGQDTESP